MHVCAAKGQSDLLLQLETERNLAQRYSQRVEKLSMRIAILQSEHNSKMQQLLAQHATQHSAQEQHLQEELSKRDKQLKALEAKAAVDSSAQKAHADAAKKAQDKETANMQSQQAHMHNELERIQKRLTRAQEVRLPAAAVSCRFTDGSPLKLTALTQLEWHSPRISRS